MNDKSGKLCIIRNRKNTDVDNTFKEIIKRVVDRKAGEEDTVVFTVFFKLIFKFFIKV